MASKVKTFLVSTADFALYYNDILACTGTTNLNTSIEVSMQEQNVNGGKGNKLVYSYKYGRELSCSLEAADWKLEYIACNVGNDIAIGLADMYKIGECATVVNGMITLPVAPIGNVAIETSGGDIITMTPVENTIDLTDKGITSGTVNVTYKFKNMAKSILIDADTSPKCYSLILDADKHNNKLGKVGSVQIEVPSYQPSGNFNISFTPDGVTSTNIDGKALAVDGDTCESGSAVYAYIREFDDSASAISVADIAVTPAAFTLGVGETKELTVIGLKGGAYSSIAVENADCTFNPRTAGVVSVDADGVVKGVSAGTAIIEVAYGGAKDIVEVTVK